MIIPETYFSFSEHTQLFIVSCIAGVLLGVVYDIFRTFRIVFPHNRLLVALEDILFSVIYIIFIVSFVSVSARGEFRVFYIFGNILGFILYLYTAGRIVIQIIRILVGIINKILHFLFHPIYLFFVMICRKIGKKFGCFYEILLKYVKIFFLHLIDIYKMLYNNKVTHKRKNVKKIGSEKSKKTKRKKRH